MPLYLLVGQKLLIIAFGICITLPILNRTSRQRSFNTTPFLPYLRREHTSVYNSPAFEVKVAVTTKPVVISCVFNDSITRVGTLDLDLPYAEPLLDLKSSEDDTGVS